MSKVELRKLVEGLTNEEKRDIILTYYHWAIQEYLVGIKEGKYALPSKDVDRALNPDPGLADRLSESIQQNDKNKILNAGVAEIFRGLNRMQRENSGPKLNAFFRGNLPWRIFDTLYTAAGLDTSKVRYDLNFPTVRLKLEDI